MPVINLSNFNNRKKLQFKEQEQEPEHESKEESKEEPEPRLESKGGKIPLPPKIATDIMHPKFREKRKHQNNIKFLF